MSKNAICEDSRKCFAKRGGHCRLLVPRNDTRSHYPDGECPFCKPIAAVTNGVTYPYNPDYFSKEAPK